MTPVVAKAKPFYGTPVHRGGVSPDPVDGDPRTPPQGGSGVPAIQSKCPECRILIPALIKIARSRGDGVMAARDALRDAGFTWTKIDPTAAPLTDNT